MNDKLLGEFLREDADSSVRRKLLAQIHSPASSSRPALQKYTFNRFNVTLDLDANRVLIEDDLVAGEEGEYSLVLEDFATALQQNE